MTWTVVWTDEAIAQLANSWLRLQYEREVITDISRWLDIYLKNRPLEEGEGREPGIRFLHFKPLSVLYEVLEAECQSKVFKVWTW